MIFVMLGSSVGAMSRFILSNYLSQFGAMPFPTLIINSVGAFLLGILLAYDVPSSRYLLGATGFLGAFTTFSTFSHETLILFKEQRFFTATLYVIGSVSLCLLLCMMGFTMN